MGVIVTITTGGPVAMETGGSGGWGRDEKVYRVHRQTGVYTVMHKQTNAKVHVGNAPGRLLLGQQMAHGRQRSRKSSPAPNCGSNLSNQRRSRWRRGAAQDTAQPSSERETETTVTDSAGPEEG